MKLNPAESIELIKGVISKLSDTNKSAKLSANYKDLLENLTYSKSMHRLESTVRNHIKIEHHLRIYLESLQNKIEHAKNLTQKLSLENNQILNKLQTQNEEFKQLIKDKQDQIVQINPQDKAISSNRDVQKLVAMEIKSYKLEEEWNRLRGSYQGKAKQCEKYRQEHEMLINARNTISTQDDDIQSVDYYFNKYREKCSQLRQLDAHLRSLKPKETRPKKVSETLLPLRTKSKSPFLKKSSGRPKMDQGISISQSSLDKTLKLISIYRDKSTGSKQERILGSKTKR